MGKNCVTTFMNDRYFKLFSFFLFQESNESLKDRMITIESEIRTLREKLANKSDDEDFDDNSVDDKPVAADESTSLSDVEAVNEVSFPSTSNSPTNDVSTIFKSTSSDLSESDRKSLRRTRLQPRRFRQVATSPDLEAEHDQDEEDEEDETQRDVKKLI